MLTLKLTFSYLTAIIMNFQWQSGREVKGAGHLESYFYDSVGSNPIGSHSCSKLDFQYSTLESAWVQLLIPSIFSHLRLLFSKTDMNQIVNQYLNELFLNT